MPVKRFYASTAPQALRAVKEAFGDSALILSYRELAPGEWRPRQAAAARRAVEVVAADEALGVPASSPARALSAKQHSEGRGPDAAADSVYGVPPSGGIGPSSSMPTTREIPLEGGTPYAESAPHSKANGNGKATHRRGIEAPIQADLRGIHETLRRATRQSATLNPPPLPPLALLLARRLTSQGIDPAFVHPMIESVCESASPEEIEDPRWLEMSARQEMEAYVLTKPLEDLGKRLDMALALTGASGVGKSTCVAKIASLLRLNFGIPVRIASLRRPGEPTPDILLTVGRLLEVSVDMIDDIKDVNECARKNAGSQKLLLDIGMPEGWLRDLRSNMAPILALCPNIETQLILSGSTKPEDLENLTRWSQTIPASAMGFTKLDETESLGCVFETARKSRMPLSFFSIGRRIPEDLLPATAAQLTEWITDDWSAARNDAPPA